MTDRCSQCNGPWKEGVDFTIGEPYDTLHMTDETQEVVRFQEKVWIEMCGARGKKVCAECYWH